MPHLVEMQERWARADLMILGVTESTAEESRSFLVEHEVPYAVLTDAAQDALAWGVEFIWGSTVYLVDPGGNIVAEGLSESEAVLAEEFGDSVSE